MKPPIQIVQSNLEGKPVTLVVMSESPDKGIEPRQILGTVELSDRQPAWDTFRSNKTFLDFLAKYLRGELGDDLGQIAGAAVEPGERFYLIDPRTPDPGGAVPPSDIVGVYDTDGTGHPLLATFRGNPNYRPIDATGAPSALLEDRQIAKHLLAKS